MPGAPTPQTLLEAIANSAPVGALPGNKTAPMPETQPVTPNAASIQLGFNANTMTNENAGGKPPLGPDMNGMWFLVSSHTLYVECGQTYKYNASLVAAIGGYLAGTILGMTDNSGLWLNLTDGNATDPDAGGAGWVPMATYGFANLTGLTGGVRNLTAAESKFGVVILNGVLTSNLTVNFPQTKQQWLIINRTSGAFTTTAKTAAGGSVGQVIPQGGFNGPFGVYSIGDGNIYPTVPPLGVAIDQNPTPLTLVERTNAGYVLATYLNQNSVIELPTVGAVFVQSTNGDGFLRKISLANFEAQMLLQDVGGQVTNGQVPVGAVTQYAPTLFTSPALTGNPTAPTAAIGDSDTSIATTRFVNPGTSLGASGYRKFPDGFILQWGTVNVATGLTVPVDIGIAFPIAFPAMCIGVFPVGIRSVGANGQAVSGSNFSSNYTLNGATITIDTNGAAAVGRWIAIGF
jgi:hypothetical protein